MKKGIIASIGVLIAVLFVVFICPKLLSNVDKDSKKYQHKMYNNVNSSIGSETVSSDGTIDEDFETHLPLVILDMGGETLPNIYQFTEDGAGREYSEEGLENSNPWINVNMKIIDNENNINTITDTPSFENNGLIKLRGMTSRGFEKKQYGIKLMEDGEELEASILGMDADEDWVLSNSILDLSGIRNYMTMNIGGQIFPYTPDVRFCEVIIKDGDNYTYQGLYLMMEKVKKGEGHIEIEDYTSNSSVLNYIVCRDRYDTTKLTLSTWASDQQLCYGYFTLVYPNENLLSDWEIKNIENELSEIEQCLYSDDPDEFLKYEDYLDVDSFVDYFLVNEFFMNYDAGNNSTYYYKTINGKLAIGPLWDYDNCFDNYSEAIANYEYCSFENQPWFERLVKDEKFQEKLLDRYEELRKTYLNTEYIENFIDDTMAYLGNASSRDYSRWKNDYEENHLLDILEDDDGFDIDRNSYSVEKEVTRIKDILNIHSSWMDTGLEEALKGKADEDIAKGRTKSNSWLIVMGVIGFFCLIILVNRKVRGEYR